MSVRFCKRSSNPYTTVAASAPYTWISTANKFMLYDVKDSDLYGVLHDKDITYYNLAGDVITNGRVTYTVYGYTKDGSSVTLE